MQREIVPTSRKHPSMQNKQRTETLRITELTTYSQNLKALAMINPDWNLSPEQIVVTGKANKKIYRINFANTPVRFLPAEECPDTTCVLINEKPVGILDQSNTNKLKSLISSTEIHSVTCLIRGGMYKIVDDSCNVEIQKNSISAILRISYQSGSTAADAVPVEKTHNKKATISHKANDAKNAKNVSKKKPFYKRFWFWILAVILTLGSCNNHSATSSPEEVMPTSGIVQTEATSKATIPVIPSTLPTEAVVFPTLLESEPSAKAEEKTTVPQVTEKTEMVWISKTGKKYHSNSNCSNMNNPSQVSLETAKSKNLTPCKNCY